MGTGTQSAEALRQYGEELRGVYRKHGVQVEGGCVLLADEVAARLNRSRTSVMAKEGLLAEVTFLEAAQGRMQRLELPVCFEGGRFESQMTLGGKAVDIAESPARPWPKRDEEDVRRVADWPEGFDDLRPLMQHLHLALVRSVHDHGLGRVLFGIREVKFGNTVEHRVHAFSASGMPPVEKLVQAIAGPYRRLWGFDQVPVGEASPFDPAWNPPVELVYGKARLMDPASDRHLIGGPHPGTFLPPPADYKAILLEGKPLAGPRETADAFCRIIQRPKAQAAALNNLGLGGIP